MRTYATGLLTLFLSFSIYTQTLSQSTEQRLIGSWKHADVVNLVGAHTSIDLKPFDLKLSKDHRFEMAGEGMVSTGKWSCNKKLLLLNVAPTADREARTQKLYVTKVTSDTLIVEVKDFEVPGGLLIVMRRKK